MNRVSGLLIYEVNCAAVNNDPDTGSPRQFPDGRGWVSSVSIHRKLRDILDNPDSEVYSALQKEVGFDPNKCHIFESLHRGLSNDPIESMHMAIDLMKSDKNRFLDTFWDFRTIGGTCLQENSEKDDNGKKVKGKTGSSGRLAMSGPYSILDGVSIAPVDVIEATLTKKAPLQEDLLMKGTGTMAPSAKKFVTHAVYCHRFGINPHYMQRNRVTEMDIALLKAMFKLIFTTSTSCTRPAGSINMLHCWWGEHNSPLGSFKDSLFYSALMPIRKDNPMMPSTSLNDYIIPDEKDIPANVNAVDLA